MRHALAVTVGMALIAVAGTASAVQLHHYGWEDGTGTILGSYGVGTPPIFAENVGAPDPVHSGTRSLKLTDNSPSGTPQAYLAWVKDLTDGDVVAAGGFWRYDTTPGASPSCRVWGHWNDSDSDIDGYDGSAGGNEDYGPGTGWDLATNTWTVADGHTGLVIEVRTYSNPGDIVWIDDIQVEIPDTATIVLIGGGSGGNDVVPEPAGLALFGLTTLAMRRRRK